MRTLRLSDLDEKSICRKHILHDFEIIKETPQLVVERCRFCGKKIKFFKKDDEVVNKYEYGKYHARDYLQYRGNTKYLFKKVFGNSAEKRILQMEKDQERQMSNDEKIAGYEKLMQRWI